MSDRSATRVFGALFVLAGALGFVPGVTSHYGELSFAGGSHAHLFGELRVSILLNLVHLAIGLVAIVFARAAGLALASLVLWLLGVFAAGGWLALDAADNWLHFVLALGLLASVALAGRLSARPALV